MDYSISELRSVYCALLRRAQVVCEQVVALRARRVWLNAEQATADIASYLNVRVYEDEEERSDEEVAESLREDDGDLSEHKLQAQGVNLQTHEATGIACFVLCPVLRQLGLFSYLKPWPFSYLSGYLHELDVLQFSTPERFWTMHELQSFGFRNEPVLGLSGFETGLLCDAYTRESLRIVSALRNLRTGLTYVRKGLEKGALQTPCVVAADEGIAQAVEALYVLTDFSSMEPAAESFSSGSTWSRGSEAINSPGELPQDKAAFMADLGL